MLKVDGRHLLHELNNRGFCEKDGDPRPVFKFSHDPQKFSNDKVNMTFSGIVECYEFT